MGLAFAFTVVLLVIAVLRLSEERARVRRLQTHLIAQAREILRLRKALKQ